MTDELSTFDRHSPGRPVFLTVLCILTFIGSGCWLINSTMQYFTADTQAATMSKVKEKAFADMKKRGAYTDEGAKFASGIINNVTTAYTPANIRKASLASISSCILCLFGALLMWRLNKNGFYIYIAGTIMGIAIPFMLFGSNLLAMGASALIGFFGILFVVLYAVNLRYLK